MVVPKMRLEGVCTLMMVEASVDRAMKVPVLVSVLDNHLSVECDSRAFLMDLCAEQ